MIDLRKLKVGDLVRNTGSGNGYVVVAIDWPNGAARNPHVTAVRSVNVSNEDEWELVRESKRIGAPSESLSDSLGADDHNAGDRGL